jgi:hypothetical protein
MNSHHSSKIRAIGDALIAAGFVSLDKQATTLGLSRSTTWTILRGNHKTSGLSVAIINRMLNAPRLPPVVRAAILDYVDGKVAGSYGHSKRQLHQFAARVGTREFPTVETAGFKALDEAS